jgi:3-methyladenine DNA glycosylase AlkD
MNQIIESVRKELRENCNLQTKISGMNFFKEKVKICGVKTALVSKIAKEYRAQMKDMKKAEIFELCKELWKSEVMEESFIACNWCYSLRNQFEKKDFALFESWVSKYITNWASCDTFCNHTLGTFIEMYPEYIRELKKWSHSSNRWMRRASAMTFIIPAKKGKFLKDIFQIADSLLIDSDDLVQKGYGWMLKAASQSHQNEVFSYVIKNKVKMPRTALRYAIEKMPVNLKRKAMEKISE